MDPRAVVATALDRALVSQQPVVASHVARLRRSRPSATPKEVLRALERHYLGTVTLMGGAAGAAAFVPVEGQAVGLAVSLLEIPAFFEATTLFALAYAEVYGVHVSDLERRRALVMSILLGDAGSKIIERFAGRAGKRLGVKVINRIPIAQIQKINRVLGRSFVTKQGRKQGILVLGREVPFGVGAAIGAGGNFAIGRGCVAAARRAFGGPPADWSHLETTPPADEAFDDDESAQAPRSSQDVLGPA